jgi:copper chaperone
MPEAAKSPQRSKSVAFRVRGLTCSKCVGVALDEIRSLPEVEQVGVRLVPFGVSLITIPAAGSADPAVVRAAILRAGFRVVSTGPMVRESVDPPEFGWEASA